MKKIHDSYIIFLLFVLAFIVRTVYIFCFFGIENAPDPDSIEYLNYAINLLSGNGYTDGQWRAFRPPGYPFFIAGVYRLFGESILTLKLIQAAISSLIPVLIYLIGLNLKNKKVATVSAVFSCFYFGLYQEPAHLVSETVWTFFLMASVLILLKTSEKKSFLFLSGIMLGITTFIRPVGLLFTAGALVWITVKFYKKQLLTAYLLFSMGFITLLAPWWIRNYKIFHTFVPVCLETGFVMKHTHASQEQLKSLHEFDNLPELERDRKNFQTGLNYLKSMPFPQLLKRWIKNFLQFLYPFMPAYDITYMLILPFWFWGIYAILKDKNVNAYLLFAMFIYFPVVVFFTGTVRYRHSMGAFFVLISGIGVEYIKNYLYGKGQNKRPVQMLFVWSVINLIVFFNSEIIRTFIKTFV